MNTKAKFIRSSRYAVSMPLCGKILSSKNSKRMSASYMLQSKRSSVELKLPNQETTIAAHFLSLEQLVKIFDTDITRGLSEAVAQERLCTDGPNALKQVQDLTLLKIFVHNLFGWFPMMLWVGSLLSIAIHFVQYLADASHFSNENLYLGSIIIIVILFTGLFAFYQEAKNVQVMKGFKDLIPLTATVIREGVSRSIPSDELVMGDIVEMSSGEMVPADVRLLEVSNLRIDMSSITGEAEPQSRSVFYTSENPLETKNLAFFSCLITDGHAKGIVVATGEQSVIGRIAGLASGVTKEETPIETEIKHFLKILCALALTFGGIFFVMVSLIQSNWIAGFYYMTGIIVANVPEGLLVTLTIALTLTAKKLKNKNCLVKKLQSVETLGAMSCICSDKTGTLTQNRMTVSHMAYNLKIVGHEEKVTRSDKNFHDFARACCLCLRAKFVESDSSKTIDAQKIKGDASESAVLRYMEGKNAASHMRNVNPKVCEIPFNSKNKYQISIHTLENKARYLLVMKGAPEIILDLCKTVLVANETKKMTTREKSILRKICIDLGQMGERVLGYCDFLLPDDEYPQGFQFDTEHLNFPIRGFRFLGMMSLIDPPRESVPEAIAKCRSAGIRVFMVTGDHPITALAISRKVGIISSNNNTPYDDAFEKDIDPKKFMESVDLLNYNAAVITGDDLRSMTAENLDLLIESVEEITFARTTPQQKLLIVESCQRIGHVVGVTGDGVNDSPALKRADIGIAMGIAGTDVSKQAADMILLDDDFSSIILGVEEGRLIFDNLKKCIAFTLTSNIPEMIPFLLYATIGIPLPLHALLIICINVLTDLWPAISLAYEKSESDIMKKPPRDLYLDRLVTSNLICMAYFQIGVIQVMAAMTSYFVAMAVHGFFPGSLLFTRARWNSPAVNDFEDSFGQEWSFEERKYLETMAQSTYYATIVLVQIADLIICKTRRVSLRHQGMSNHMLNIGIIVEFGISLVILYVPIFNNILYTAPIPWILWLPGLPYIVIIIVADELRRYLIRKYPNSWIDKELYY